MADDDRSSREETEWALAEEEAFWIRSIRAAKDRLFEDVSIDTQERREIEEGLLRDLGLRAPRNLGALAALPSKKDDKNFLAKQKRLSHWFRYLVILHEQPGTPEKLARYAAGDDRVALKTEAWAAGIQLFTEIGGGRSPVHIRQTLQSLGREFGTHDPGAGFRVPVPTGDPPVEKVE